MNKPDLVASALSVHCPSMDEMRAFIDARPWIWMIARERERINPLYGEPCVIYFAWMLLNRKCKLLEAFPLPFSTLRAMAADFGEVYAID